MLVLVGDDASAEVAFCSFSFEDEVCTVACRSVVKCYYVVVYPAVSLLADEDVAYPHVLCMCLFEAVQVERSVVADIGFDDLCGKEISVISGMIAEQQFYLCSFFSNNKYATVYHQVHVGTQYVDYLYGFVDDHAFRYVYEQSVLCEHRVECRNAVLIALGDLSVIFSHKLRLLGCDLI